MKSIDSLAEYKDLLPTLKETISNILSSDSDERTYFNEQVIADEILIYVFRDRPIISDSNRYEWMHQLNAKVSIISQGWKLNCGNDVAHSDETFDSIVDYIEMTYGTHRRQYAA